MPNSTKGPAPLASLRVLDLADEKASFCSRLLADLGAEVIKVERPGGDASRWLGPFWGNLTHPEKSLSYWYNNAGKYGVTLNLESEEGQDILARLAGRADVIVETFAPGYLKKIGLDYERLSKHNPGLIMASVTGFGQTGPYKRRKSCDIVASACGGQMYVSGHPEAPPLRPYGQQSYYAASLFAATGILIALRERRHSGKGRHIDISLQEAVAATLEHVMVRYFYGKAVPGRQGGLHWTNFACLLPCQDGHIFITFGREWDTLIELLDSEGMAADLKDEPWREEEYRRQHSDHVIEVLAAWTRTHTKSELFQLGQLMRFPWAPVSTISEMFDSPHLRSRDFFAFVEHAEVKKAFFYPLTPFRFNVSACRIQRRAPLIGEHNVRVYQKELGISAETLTRLSSLGII